MPTPVVGSFDGARLTVNSILKRPGVIRERVLQLADQQFITDVVLRKVQDIPSGVLTYDESTPIFADVNPLQVAEGAEIPLATTSEGTPKTVRSVKYASGVRITEEMRRRNDIDKLNRDITRVVNSMKATWENRFLALALANFATTPAGTVWASATTVRQVLASAMLAIQLADADSSNQTGVNKFGFEPDTLILHHARAMDLALNADMNKYFVGSDRTAAADSLSLPGLLFGQFKVVKSWRVDPTQAILLESKTVGGYADERPLEVSNLYQDQTREMWRANVVRSSALFMDQPKAGIVITGVA